MPRTQAAGWGGVLGSAVGSAVGSSVLLRVGEEFLELGVQLFGLESSEADGVEGVDGGHEYDGAQEAYDGEPSGEEVLLVCWGDDAEGVGEEGDGEHGDPAGDHAYLSA